MKTKHTHTTENKMKMLLKSKQKIVENRKRNAKTETPFTMCTKLNSLPQDYYYVRKYIYHFMYIKMHQYYKNDFRVFIFFSATKGGKHEKSMVKVTSSCWF